MHLAGPKGPSEKRKAELIGGLYLVGTRGKFCAVITERQITIERFDGKGVRLDLAAIERMRHLKIPMLPSGAVLIGLLSIYLGITTILPPINVLAIVLGVSIIVTNILSRYSILAIETSSGDRHLISGNESNLLKLCLVVDRVRHGVDIDEALVGLESLETELPTFPAIRDAKGMLGLGSLAESIQPSISRLEGNKEEAQFSGDSFQFEEKEDYGTLRGGFSAEEYETENYEVLQKEKPIFKGNAYERAWGGREPPSWYREKETVEESVSRIDSAFSDAAEGLEMFSPGGIFDFDEPSEISKIGDMGAFPNPKTEEEILQDRPPSSAQMIKRAHMEFGAPLEPYSGTILPPPTEEAVREECKAGVVKQAKARQELKVSNQTDKETIVSNLEDYPALNRLASTMSGSRIHKVKSGKRGATGWIARLLSPGSAINKPERKRASNDPIETERFQTSQYMRLRSDQDHQGEIGSRIRSMSKNTDASTARDKLDSIVNNISNGGEGAPKLLELPNETLRFNQLRPTSSKEDPHPLPGLKRLG